MEKMNLVTKLTQARQELAAANLRKSGKNQHLGFDYFELADFLPTVVALEAKYGMISTINMSNELATLEIQDGEEGLEFSCPFVMADLAKAQPTQNLGAAITYIKRYLYTMAYAIEEGPDVLDLTMGEDDKPALASDAQISAIERMHCNIDNICAYYSINSIYELTKQQASEVIKKKAESLQR